MEQRLLLLHVLQHEPFLLLSWQLLLIQLTYRYLVIIEQQFWIFLQQITAASINSISFVLIDHIVKMILLNRLHVILRYKEHLHHLMLLQL